MFFLCYYAYALDEKKDCEFLNGQVSQSTGRAGFAREWMSQRK